MARGRMLDKALSKSKKLQALKRDHRLIYVSILPFLDREGRTRADPLYLKATIFNHSDFTTKELAQGIAAIADAGLVTLYGDEDNEALIEFTRFHEFNTPNRKEARSEYTSPSDAGAMSVLPKRDKLAFRTQDSDLHVQCTGNARAMHVQSTELARDLHVENVNENVNVNVNVNVNGITSTPKPAFFLKLWNENRGPLSGADRLTPKREKAFNAFAQETGPDATQLFTDATRYVAADTFWLKNGYGLDNLLVQGRIVEKAEKYRTYGSMSYSDREMAVTAMTIAAALEGKNA
jgi:hypothetical protein